MKGWLIMKKSTFTFTGAKGIAKKLFCLLCAIAIIGSIAAPIESVSAADDEYIIADFSNADSSAASVFGFTVDSEITYGESTASASWNHSADSDYFILPHNGKTRNWSNYNYVNLRVYSSEKNAGGFSFLRFNDATWGGGRYYTDIRVNWEGWTDISLPLHLFTRAAGTVNWAETYRFYFRSTPITGSKVKDGVKINFDKIWLSKTRASNDVEVDDDVLTIARFNNYSNIIGLNSTLSVDSQNTYLYDVSGKWNVPKGTPVALDVIFPNAIDASDYDYVNFLMYSPTTTGANVEFFLYPDSLGNNQNNKHEFNVNWAGWKLFSVPMAKAPSTESTATHFYMTSQSKWTNIAGMKLRIMNSPTADPLNLEKIWLSKQPASDLSAFELCNKEDLDGMVDVRANGSNFDVRFSRQLAASQKNAENVKVFKTSDTSKSPVPCNITFAGDTMSVKIIGTLEFDTGYTIEIGEGLMSDYVYSSDGSDVVTQTLGETETINFHTTDYTISIFSNGSEWDGKQGTIDEVSISSSLLNHNPIIYVAKYNGAYLTKIVKVDATLLTFDDISVAAGDTIRVFLWDDSLSPLCNDESITVQ